MIITKNITRIVFERLFHIVSDNFVAIETISTDDFNGFRVIGRVVGDEYREYSDRKISWTEYFSGGLSNIWDYLESTEQVCTYEVYPKEKYFDNKGKKFCVTELEFNEVMPLMMYREFLLIIERGDFNK